MQKIPAFSIEKIFERLFKNKSQKKYWNYIYELRKLNTKEIYQKAVELTKSIHEKEKIIGINIIAQFGYPRKYRKRTLKIYFDLLKNEKDRKVISSILYGIGDNNKSLTENQIDFLLQYKFHRSVFVRHSLTCALSGIENTKAINTLIKLTKDKDSDTRDWATFGIGSQIKTDNLEIRQALWERVYDSDKGTRDEAILGLAKRKDLKIKEILKIELDKADNLGSSTLEAIESLDDKDFINLIEEKIQKNKNELLINEEWLKSTLNKLRSN